MPPATQTKSTPALRKNTETFAPAQNPCAKVFRFAGDFADEQAKIFSTQWLLVGIRVRSRKPGDYFLAQVVGESLIIVRDQKSEIRGSTMFVVMRDAPKGGRIRTRIAIQCPYHA